MQDIEINGNLRDLRHLQRFIVTVRGKGRDGADLRVAVLLGLHTVSKSCQMGQHNMMDENNKPRQFCEDRYAFSLTLPNRLSQAISDNYFSWESEDKNRVLNYAVIDVPPMKVRNLQDGEYQVVFFYLYPADKEQVDVDVNFVVTSCHSRQVVFNRIKRRYNIHTLLRTCFFNGKKIP